MAYRPPTKSTYGDELTLEDKWNQPHPTDAYGYSPDSGQQQLPQPPRPVFGQPSNYAPNQHLNQPLSNQLQSNANLTSGYKELANSLTPEDILFMRQWQRDSYYYRVLPINGISWGLLYMYNKQKQLPHKASRYAVLGLTSFILGKWMYRDEFKKRLVESKSNTPYMQTFRKHFGVPPINPDGDYSQVVDQTYSGLDSYAPGTSDSIINDPCNKPTGDGGFGYRPPGQELGFTPAGLHDNLDNSKLEVPKQPTSYEELRARNRGIIR